jgi:hypothetical protein
LDQERDALVRQHHVHVELRSLGLGAKRHIDEVRPKQEALVVGHDLQVDPSTETGVEKERRLESSHAGTQYYDARRW